MGLGKDLLALSKYYRVTGSDYSPLFLDEFCSKHPEIEVLEVNAANFSLNNKFDCIYSNKVLYHLSAPEFRRSLQLQAEQGSPHILHCGRNILEIRRKLSMGTSRFLKLCKMRSGYMELRGLEKNSDRLIKRLL